LAKEGFDLKNYLLIKGMVVKIRVSTNNLMIKFGHSKFPIVILMSINSDLYTAFGTLSGQK